MQLKELNLKNVFFLAILIGLAWTLLQLFTPFLSIIVIALVIVQLFHPVYKSILKYVRRPALASVISTLLTLIFVIIPVIVILLLAIGEISYFSTNTNLTVGLEALSNLIQNSVSNINAILSNAGINSQIVAPDLQDLALRLLSGLESGLLPTITNIITFSLNAIFEGILLIITLIYFFIEYENIPKMISRISPLDDELDTLLWQKFSSTTRAVIKGNLLVAIAQASSVSIVMVLFGVGAPVLLWIIMVLLSLVPIGSGVVWLPVGLALIFSGNPVQGIFLIVYGTIAINVIDPLLRPQLMKGAVQLHPLVIIFSALGGITLFGPLGLLYGPLIAVFFTSLMDVYNIKFNPDKSNPLNTHAAAN